MTTYIILDDKKYELSLSDRTLFFQEGEKVFFIDEDSSRKDCIVAKVIKVLRRTGNKIDADFEVYLQK